MPSPFGELIDCYTCARLISSQPGQILCVAFAPGVVPVEILQGARHDKPIEGDRGLTYLPYDGLTDETFEDAIFEPTPQTTNKEGA